MFLFCATLGQYIARLVEYSKWVVNMHFRVRKNVIQLIRTNYDETKKKGVNTIIGVVKLAKPELSTELRQVLTSEEVAAFEAWINTKHRTNVLREELAALTLAETLNLAEKWFEREGKVRGSAISVKRDCFSLAIFAQTLRKKRLVGLSEGICRN